MLKKLFGYSMATWVGALLAFLIVPLASHMYPKQELGTINYYYSVVNIAFTILLLGLDQAYLRFYSELKPENRRQTLFRANIVVTVLLTGGCLVLCMPFCRRISGRLLGYDFPGILWLLFFHLSGLIITRYYGILFRLQASFWKYTVVSVFNTLLLKAAYVAGGLFSKTAQSGVAASAILAGIVAVLLLMAEKNTLRFRLTREERRLFKQEIRYGGPLIPAMLIAILNNNLPIFFLRNSCGFEAVAEYSVGITLASAITLIHNGLNTFLEPYIFEHHKTDEKRVAVILDLFTKAAFFACLAVVCVQDLFFLVFEKSYSSVTAYLPILLASSVWYSVGEFYNIGVKIHKQPERNIPVYTMGILLNMALCAVLVPAFGNLGAAISAATASFAVGTLKSLVGNRYYPVWKEKGAYFLGSCLLVLVSVGNLLLAGSRMRYVLIGAVWLLSGLVFGIYQEILGLIRRWIG